MQPEQPDTSPDQPSSDASEAPSEGEPKTETQPPPTSEAPGGGWVPSFQILRSRHDRKLGGVAGGLAAAAGVDPTLVRLAVLLGCLTGWGILAYLIAWAVIPEEDPAKNRYLMPAPESTGKYLRIGMLVVAGLGVLHVLGAVLGVVSSALIGLGLFPAHLFGIADNDGFEAGEGVLGLMLLIGGLLLVFRHQLPWVAAPGTGPGNSGAPGGSWAPPSTPPSSTVVATISPGGGGAGAAGTYGPPPPYGSAGATGSGTPGGTPGAGGFGPGSAGFSARASAAARVARTNAPLLLTRATGWLVALWFLAAAIIAGIFWLTGALEVRLPVLPIVASVGALAGLGYALVRSRRIAVVIGAMALLLVPSALAGALVRIEGQAGDRSVTPIVASDLQPEYRHAIGAFVLDLTRLQLPTGRTPIDIKMGAGKVQVIVPWDANVEAAATVTAGAFDLFGNRQTGVNLDGRTRDTGQPGAPLLVIDAEAGAGEIIVRRGFEPITQQALRTGQPVPMQCSPSSPYTSWSTAPLRCGAADGVTQTPALACVVHESGEALCRPPGEAEPAVPWASFFGTRRCQVPAGGGESVCTNAVAGQPAQSGTFTCTIPAGGGEAVCRPAGPGATKGNPPPVGPTGAVPPADPAASTDPTSPADPASPATTAPTAQTPGEYRCTIPEGGGTATCQPI